MSAATDNPQTPAMPRPAVRVIVSALVIFHVLAVFVGPWAMQPSSELATTFGRTLQPYLDALFLANGYRFFAPEPGPSHLVRYEATLADGRLVTGEFPDRRHHFPRLLYHRHFMLSEFANTLSGPQAARERAELVARGYAAHLANALDARTVRLYLRRHYVPRVDEVRRGMLLSDKSLYEERPLSEYTRGAP